MLHLLPVIFLFLCSSPDPTLEIVKPSFSEPAGELAFQEGCQLFRAGAWRAAEKSFRRARKHAAGDASQVVKSWLRGCKGGRKLADVEKAIGGERWKVAWARLVRQPSSGSLRCHIVRRSSPNRIRPSRERHSSRKSNFVF